MDASGVAVVLGLLRSRPVRGEPELAGGGAKGERVRVRKCQGAGQVALNGFPGSIWPWARGGRSPPAAYGGRREQSRPGERDGDKGIFVISEISGTSR